MAYAISAYDLFLARAFFTFFRTLACKLPNYRKIRGGNPVYRVRGRAGRNGNQGVAEATAHFLLKGWQGPCKGLNGLGNDLMFWYESSLP